MNFQSKTDSEDKRAWWQRARVSRVRIAVKLGRNRYVDSVHGRLSGYKSISNEKDTPIRPSTQLTVSHRRPYWHFHTRCVRFVRKFLLKYPCISVRTYAIRNLVAIKSLVVICVSTIVLHRLGPRKAQIHAGKMTTNASPRVKNQIPKFQTIFYWTTVNTNRAIHIFGTVIRHGRRGYRTVDFQTSIRQGVRFSKFHSLLPTNRKRIKRRCASSIGA